jgi:hypothetical protein
VLKTPHLKAGVVTKLIHVPRSWADPLYDIAMIKEHESWYLECYVRSLYMSGSLRAVARELITYNLDLVGVQRNRWDRGGI